MSAVRSTRRKAAPEPAIAPAKGGTMITGCVITQNAAPANEHTAQSIVALANAITANANACAEAARALARSGGTFAPAMLIGAPQ